MSSSSLGSTTSSQNFSTLPPMEVCPDEEWIEIAESAIQYSPDSVFNYHLDTSPSGFKTKNHFLGYVFPKNPEEPLENTTPSNIISTVNPPNPSPPSSSNFFHFF